MNISLKTAGKLSEANNEMVVLFGKTGKSTMLSSLLPKNIKDTLALLLKVQPELDGYEKNASTIIYQGKSAFRVTFVGTGEQNKITAETIRMLGGTVSRSLKAQNFEQPQILLPAQLEQKEDLLQAFCEGLLMGGYVFDEYKSKKAESALKTVTIIASNLTSVRKAVKEAQIIADSVNYARDLVNRPGNVVYPAVMADQAKTVAKQAKLSCKVLEEKDMEQLGMGAFLSVTKGSEQPAKLIVLEYKGNAKSSKKTAFVGKGITFDSGGISIKPSGGMEEMKDDMGGAAAVLAAIRAIALLQLPVNIVAVLPCAENMPSGIAARPGDIVKSASGKTIEIISTDAEGRMILADAVWYADSKLGAENIVDIATLTGAASVALGEFVAGVVTNEQLLCDKVMAASIMSGEKCWQMPTFAEYKEYNKSEVADIRNSGGRFGGMITGGLFIGEFTQKPWVHIDIGNTVSSKKNSGYNVRGATGFGVRLLVETARRLSV